MKHIDESVIRNLDYFDYFDLKDMETYKFDINKYIIMVPTGKKVLLKTNVSLIDSNDLSLTDLGKEVKEREAKIIELDELGNITFTRGGLKITDSSIYQRFTVVSRDGSEKTFNITVPFKEPDYKELVAINDAIRKKANEEKLTEENISDVSLEGFNFGNLIPGKLDFKGVDISDTTFRKKASEEKLTEENISDVSLEGFNFGNLIPGKLDFKGVDISDTKFETRDGITRK